MPIEYVLTGPYRIEYRSYEEPPLGPHEVRVRTIVSGMKPNSTSIAAPLPCTPSAST